MGSFVITRYQEIPLHFPKIIEDACKRSDRESLFPKTFHEGGDISFKIGPRLFSACQADAFDIFPHDGHLDSEATKAFKEIAHRCKEYVGVKETEKQSEREKFPYHFKEQEVKR